MELFKILSSWAMLACCPFVMLFTTYENQTPLLVGFGMMLSAASIMDSISNSNQKRMNQ